MPTYKNYNQADAVGPPEGSFTITASDSADIAHPTSGESMVAKGLYLEAAATVKVTWQNGMVDTLPLPAGANRMLVRRVWATPAPGTTIHVLV